MLGARCRLQGPTNTVCDAAHALNVKRHTALEPTHRQSALRQGRGVGEATLGALTTRRHSSQE